MEFRIDLSLMRKVVAVKSDGTIKKGEIYTVTNVRVGRTSTTLLIDGVEYNSVLFHEIEDSALMKAVSKAKEGAKFSTIARFSEAKDIKLLLMYQKVTICKKVLANMEVGDVLTIGRLNDCDICCDDNDMFFLTSVSRMHCFVYRETEKRYRLIDCSSFGTEICL
jgi:hypothetical protein